MASVEQLKEAVNLLLSDKVSRSLRYCRRKSSQVKFIIYLLKFFAYTPMGASGIVAIEWYNADWSQTLLIIMPALSAISTFFLTQFNLIRTYESFEKARRKLKRLEEDTTKDLLFIEEVKEYADLYLKILTQYQEIERDLSLSVIRSLSKRPTGNVTKHYEMESMVRAVNGEPDSSVGVQPTEYIRPTSRSLPKPEDKLGDKS